MILSVRLAGLKKRCKADSRQFRRVRTAHHLRILEFQRHRKARDATPMQLVSYEEGGIYYALSGFYFKPNHSR